MSCRVIQCLLCLLILLPLGCGASSRPSHPSVSSAKDQSASPPEPSVTPAPQQSDSVSGDIEGVYTEDGMLSHIGYEIEKRSRTVKFEGTKYDTEIQYAVLKKNGKVVAKFDGLSHPLGTEVRFGLFPLLGQVSNQIIVEQTTHRGWRYWVVDLSPNFRIIYDSGDYPVGYSLRALDLNHDGRYELIHTLHTFWFFNKLANTNSPFIDVVFKYNPKTRKYVPANPEFQEYALREVEQKIRKAREVKEKWNGTGYDGDLLGAVLEVALPYIYAGKEQEGWSFYEEYNSLDKEAIKSEIKKALEDDSIYRAIKRAT